MPRTCRECGEGRKGECNAECCTRCCPQLGCTTHRQPAERRRCWQVDLDRRHSAAARLGAVAQQQQDDQPVQQPNQDGQPDQPQQQQQQQQQPVQQQPPVQQQQQQQQQQAADSDVPAWMRVWQAQQEQFNTRLLSQLQALSAPRTPPRQPAPSTPAQRLPAAPEAAPPSHLSSFPLPAGGLSLDAALANLPAPEVIPTQHNTAIHTFNQSGGSTTINLTPPPARHTSRLTDEPAGSEVDCMPSNGVPLSPADAKKAPATPQQFDAMLGAWLDRNPILQNSAARLAVWGKYVRQAVEYANTTSTAAALAYHHMAYRAFQHEPRLYDPGLHGPTYEAAYSRHIHPVLLKAELLKAQQYRARAPWPAKDDPSSPRKTGLGKRKKGPGATPAAPEPQPAASVGNTQVCSMHGPGNHSTAECRTLKRQKSDRQQAPKATASA